MKEELKARFSEAVEFKNAGQFERAKAILLGLHEENPDSTAVLAVLGNVCWDMGLLEEAAGSFKRAIRLSPTLEAVSLGLFHCLWKLGKTDEAFEEMKRFQTLSHSDDYREIVKEINEKSL